MSIINLDHLPTWEQVRKVAVDAHRDAKHAGRWEFCDDPICAALERWMHFEAIWTPVR